MVSLCINRGHTIAIGTPSSENKTIIFLKRNNAFYPGERCGFYLAATSVADASRKIEFILVVQGENKDVAPGRGYGYDWYYDAERSLLTHCDFNLCLTVNTEDWTLGLEKCGNANQAFIYDASLNELFWNNPITKKLHVIYIQQDVFEYSIRGPNRCYVAVNSMDMIDKYEEISIIKQRQRKWKRSTAYSLSKCNETRDLSADTLRNWFGIIESFAHNNVTFGLFKTPDGAYLLGDGHVILFADADKFQWHDYKFYGLWKIDPIKGYLIHYLSGNCVAAIHPDLSTGIQQFRQMGILRSNAIDQHYRDLKLFGVDNTGLGPRQFVTVNSKYHMHMTMNNCSVPVTFMLSLYGQPPMCFAFGNLSEMQLGLKY